MLSGKLANGSFPTEPPYNDGMNSKSAEEKHGRTSAEI